VSVSRRRKWVRENEPQTKSKKGGEVRAVKGNVMEIGDKSHNRGKDWEETMKKGKGNNETVHSRASVFPSKRASRNPD